MWNHAEFLSSRSAKHMPWFVLAVLVVVLPLVACSGDAVRSSPEQPVQPVQAIRRADVIGAYEQDVAWLGRVADAFPDRDRAPGASAALVDDFRRTMHLADDGSARIVTRTNEVRFRGTWSIVGDELVLEMSSDTERTTMRATLQGRDLRVRAPVLGTEATVIWRRR